MSAIDALGGAASTSASASATPSAYGELTTDQFVKIMFTELTNQDPFKPNDSQAMLDQLSSLRSIESDMEMGDRLDNMVSRNDFAAASGLIGKVISGITEDNENTIDSVFSVSQTEQGPILNLLGGQRVRLENLIEVADAPAGDGADADE